MAKLSIDPKREPFARELERQFTENNVRLSARAKDLLFLGTEAWLDEQMPVRSVATPTENQMRQLARDIVREAMQDPHVQRAKSGDRELTFEALLVSLSEAGKKVAVGLFDKGF